MIRSTVLGLFAALGLLGFTAAANAADPELKPYFIQPGSTYTYKPGPEGPGIPGGQPSAYELDFGVGGTFTVEYDRTVYTARLLNVELVLTGNEAVQMNPPNAFLPVTAERVEDWLEARLFHNLFVAAPWDQYQAEDPPGLHLFDFLQGSVRLEGGYEHTAADGDGMLFDINAREQPIPEPGVFALAGIGLALATAVACGKRR